MTNCTTVYTTNAFFKYIRIILNVFDSIPMIMVLLIYVTRSQSLVTHNVLKLLFEINKQIHIKI